MRIAPIPLYGLGQRISDINTLDYLAADAAKLTHQHPLGFIPAAFTAHVIYRLASDKNPEKEIFKNYIREGLESVQRMFTNHTEEVEKFVSLVKKAILLSDISIDNVHAIENELGGGWIAEETVAIAIYCTLSYFDNFERAMIAAVNHAGDSDSTGAVTGNLLGAAIGYNAIPQFYKNDLELHDVILHVAAGADSPFQVQALCSTQRSAPLAAELCARYHVPQCTTNYLELLQWVDVVYLAVPNLQHTRYAKVALEAGKHVIVEKPMAPTAAQTEELAALSRHKRVFLFEALTTQYLENYHKIRELLPRIGTVKLVQCNFSQYSSRYDAFCAGQVAPSFDPNCAGGALMDLNVYNISYIVGLFGEPNRVNYAANIDHGIDTSGILTMDYSGFKAVSMAAKDCGAPARYVIQGTKGYLLQKSTANYCGGLTLHLNDGKEEHYNLNGGRPRLAAEFEAFARAIEGGDQELCSRMLDTSIAVSRVLTAARRSAGIRFPCDQ